jgi:hypothetical protein
VGIIKFFLKELVPYVAGGSNSFQQKFNHTRGYINGNLFLKHKQLQKKQLSEAPFASGQSIKNHNNSACL